MDVEGEESSYFEVEDENFVPADLASLHVPESVEKPKARPMQVDEAPADAGERSRPRSRPIDALPAV
jgi:hypothetical protein